MRKWILASGAVAMLATPAVADWQYTKWGMTEAQVVVASSGGAAPKDTVVGNSHFVALAAPYKSGDYGFTARFRFDDLSKGLNKVDLDLDDISQAERLYSDLHLKYGEPMTLRMDSGPIIPGLAEWKTDTDHVTFRYIKVYKYSDVTLSYEPLHSKSADGL